MSKSAICIATVSLLLAGCATPMSSVTPYSANVSLPGLATAVGTQPTQVISISREFLLPPTELQTTYAPDVPSAYLILTAGEDSAGRRMCDAWMQLPTSEQVLRINPSAKIAKTYWLLGDGSSETDKCKNLVKHYDFSKANMFRAAFGLPAGTLLAVRFPDNHTFYVDLTKASARQDQEILLSWYTVASTTTQPGTILQSTSIAANMQRVICAKDSKIMASFTGVVSGALGPFGFIVGIGEQALCSLTIV